jgi:hypothetical protein
MRAPRHLGSALVALSLAAGCGVTAGNPGDGGKPPKFTLAGTVSTMEGPQYGPLPLTLDRQDTDYPRAATSVTDGTFAFRDLAAGTYALTVARNFRQTVYLHGDVILSVNLPLPAAPSALRHVPMGPYYFCLLWTDNSGLEAGFVLNGPRAYAVPANKIGVVESFLNYPLSATGTNDYAEAARRWNDRFAGTYALHAYNEYGATLTIEADVPPNLAGIWDLRFPPPDVNQRAREDEDVARCLAAAPPISDSGTAFLEP